MLSIYHYMKIICYFLFIQFTNNITYGSHQQENLSQKELEPEEITDSLLLPKKNTEKTKICIKMLPYGNPTQLIFAHAFFGNNMFRNALDPNQPNLNENIENQMHAFSYYYDQYHDFLKKMNKIKTLNRLFCFNMYLFFVIHYLVLVINLIINENMQKNVKLSILFVFITPVILLFIGYLSLHLNKGVFFIRNNNEPNVVHNYYNYIFPDMDITNPDFNPNIWKENIEVNHNYYLYKIKRILSPWFNLIIIIMQSTYVILQFLALLAFINIPEILGFSNIQDMEITYKVFYLFNIIIEFILLIYNMIFWNSIRGINNTFSKIYSSLIIPGDINITNLLIRQFINYLIPF